MREPNPFSFYLGEKRVRCYSLALFFLPYPQIMGMLIGVDGVESLINKV